MEEEEKAIEEINNSLVNDFDDVVMKKTRSNSLDGVFDLEDVDIKNIIDQTEERGTMYPFEGIVPSVEQSPYVFKTGLRIVMILIGKWVWARKSALIDTWRPFSLIS